MESKESIASTTKGGRLFPYEEERVSPVLFYSERELAPKVVPKAKVRELVPKVVPKVKVRELAPKMAPKVKVRELAPKGGPKN